MRVEFTRGDLIALEKTIEIIEEIVDERKRQDRKWGAKNLARPMEVWLAVIMEEVGEAAQAFLMADGHNPGSKSWDDLRKELVESAAVCAAAVQTLDAHRRLRRLKTTIRYPSKKD